MIFFSVNVAKMLDHLKVRELVATAENKQEYDSTTPNHTHEPIKHKGH